MSVDTLPSTLLVGKLSALEAAYPADLRREISARVDVLAPPVDSQNWREHREPLSRAKIILGTWGMPKMNEEFLDAVPNLRAVKPGATLLNTSRGAVVNERDLCEVLAERQDLTAVLDVTHPEPPPPDSPLFHLDNVFMTPHISGSKGGEIARMGTWMVEEMGRFLEGEPLHHAVTEPMLATMA